MDEGEFRERLAHEASAWRRDGIITELQEQAILERYGPRAGGALSALRMGWFVTAVSVIGALVLAGGVVLLFASNWEEMPDWLRTSLVLAGMLIAYGAGYALIYRFDMQRTGSAMLLLGVALFQAGLFLLAQIYNMPVESPVLLLLGAIGTAPLAYAFGSRIVLLLAVAQVTAWVVWELALRYPDAPESWAALVIVGVFGVALYAAGRLHAARTQFERMGEALMLGGVLVLIALVYTFSFVDLWDEVISDGVEAYEAPLFLYAATLAAAGLVSAQWLLSPRDLERRVEIGAQLLLLALAAVVATWPAWTGWAVVFNGVYFAVASAIVVRGFMRGDERYVNFGLAVVVIGLLTRYIDVFWSLLAGSAFFITGGVFLLVVAFAVERLRRELIRGMSDAEGPRPQGGAAEGTAA